MKIFARFAALASAIVFAGSLPLFGGPPASRIRAGLADGNTFSLNGTISPRLASAVDKGRAEDTLLLPRITMHFKMTDAQQADLDQLLEAQQNPASSQYHQWLTPEQYADRFGLSQNDMAQITAWLQQKGFTDIQPAHGRAFVTMTGTAARVKEAFGAEIHYFDVNGKTHYANSNDVVLPTALEGVVSGIRGLNDFRPKRRSVGPRGGILPRYTSNLTGNHFLAPGDFATIYDINSLYSSGINGTGQSIAIAGQTDIALSDIENFQSAAGLPIKDPKIVLDGTDPGGIPCDPDTNDTPNCSDLGESDLDIEWAGAVARGANIVFVNSTDAWTSAEYAIDQNLAQVLSITYGSCEAQTDNSDLNGMNAAFQQGNAQGITTVAASGDTGASDCDYEDSPPALYGLAVDFPCSSPYVTCAGGTEFNEGSGNYWSSVNGANGGSANKYIPEIAWNDIVYDYDNTANGTEPTLSASGGGASQVFSKPSWQTGPGVPADGARDVPDVAFSASVDHDAYLDCSSPDLDDLTACTSGFRDSQTYFDVAGGTSAATPTFAGVVALVNQKTGTSQGNINPALYTLAAQQSTANCNASNPASACVFHDITSGNNNVPCQQGSTDCPAQSPVDMLGYTTYGFSAGPGYDQVTGLGTPDVYNLVTGIGASNTPGQVTLNASGEFFAPSSGSGSIGVTETGIGSWTATPNASWITITGSASGSGSGTVSYALAPNTGASRSGTITVNGQTFTITQEGTSSDLSSAGSMAQIASGGGWNTTLTLIDLGAGSAEARLNFSDNSGDSLVLPFTSPQQTFSGTMLGATMDQTIAPYGQLVLDMAGSSSDPTSTGWAQLSSATGVNGFAIFESNGQEAVVPLETRNASSYVLAFDNTGALATGLAVANLANSSATIPVIIRDDTGAQIDFEAVPTIPAQGHNSFMLTDATQGFPVTAGKRGTIEFSTPKGGQISVLGLRANGAAITTLPVLANVSTGGGLMAHIASGGGWQTIITLVNTGASSTQAQLNFYDENGNPMTLPLLFPQTGATSNVSSVSQTLAAGSSLLLQTQGGASQQIGSAQLTTTGTVSGFAIFQNSGQEAVVPLETGTPDSITLVFDNTNGLGTGVALANISGSPVSVPATLRDYTGATLATGSVSLPANGHASFMLASQFPAAANIRGSVEFGSGAAQIGALGIRATAAGAYTTIPAMAQ